MKDSLLCNSSFIVHHSSFPLFPPCIPPKSFCIFTPVLKSRVSVGPDSQTKRRAREAPFGALNIQDQSDFVFPQTSLDTPDEAKRRSVAFAFRVKILCVLVMAVAIHSNVKR